MATETPKPLREHLLQHGRTHYVTERLISAEQCFRSLVLACAVWQDRHMDQWEKFKFDTEFGLIFVTISMHDEYPDSFDLVDRETGRVIRQAGLTYPLVPVNSEPVPSANKLAEIAGRDAWWDGKPCDPPPLLVEISAWTFGWRSAEMASRLGIKREGGEK